ncbi:hypothetical protein BJX63DRAFT_332351 [Aspergillus granulosus]|uniref:Uncharacterized protein n=1 Tax=Aspergillus granulosus TaxID=176169 RepID=A0ABR4H534_9EURO
MWRVLRDHNEWWRQCRGASLCALRSSSTRLFTPYRLPHSITDRTGWGFNWKPNCLRRVSAKQRCSNPFRFLTFHRNRDHRRCADSFASEQDWTYWSPYQGWGEAMREARSYRDVRSNWAFVASSLRRGAQFHQEVAIVTSERMGDRLLSCTETREEDSTSSLAGRTDLPYLVTSLQTGVTARSCDYDGFGRLFNLDPRRNFTDFGDSPE